MLHKCITLCSPHVQILMPGKMLILSDRDIMVGEEEPQLRPGSMWEHFHFHKHGKAFNHQFPVTKKEENQRKQTAKQRLLSFSPLSVSHAGICLACCSGRRSWHCMNKYLHINTQVILYKQLNRYLLERKCKLQSCTVTIRCYQY